MAFGKKKEETALVKTGPNALALPDFIKAGDTRGGEDIAREDLVLPRLALAQPQSPQIDAENPKYVEGLKAGDAYNTLTGEVYGRDPINVVIVRAEPARFIEFNPMEEGGGIKDFNVAHDDPRTQFTTDEEGHTVKPVATKFLEFVALKDGEPLALSFKGSGLKTARQINGLIKLRNAPSFASVFALTPTRNVKDNTMVYYTFTAKLVGNVDEETYRYAEQVYNSLAGKTITYEREEDVVEAEPAAEKTPF